MEKLTMEDLTYLNKQGYIFPADNGEFKVMKYGDDERQIMKERFGDMRERFEDKGIDIIQ